MPEPQSQQEQEWIEWASKQPWPVECEKCEIIKQKYPTAPIWTQHFTYHVEQPNNDSQLELREAPTDKLGGMLKAYRLSLRLKQIEFARKYGYESATAVSLWESGYRSMPNDVVLDLITAHDKKLLAEVRGRVIGEDEYVKDFSSIAQESIEPAMRNEFREQQRKQLDAIEGEL